MEGGSNFDGLSVLSNQGHDEHNHIPGARQRNAAHRLAVIESECVGVHMERSIVLGAVVAVTIGHAQQIGLSGVALWRIPIAEALRERRGGPVRVRHREDLRDPIAIDPGGQEIQGGKLTRWQCDGGVGHCIQRIVSRAE